MIIIAVYLPEILKNAPNMESKTIIHVQIKETDKHYYFGSLKAIYTTLSRQEVGAGYDTLTRRGFLNDPNYHETKNAIIRKGEIIRMSKSQDVKERLIEL